MATKRKAKALEGQSYTRVPFFDGYNYTYWETKIGTFLISCGFDLWLIVLDGHMAPRIRRRS